ncbi:MAG: LysR family transcriptional regulator [Oceanospirillaceae bacterium]|nr:LysR family transcriptional regulator [Oceanospirillaceae bacterium]
MVALSQLDFKLLLCLNALIAHKNVSRAADEMHMSQPSMSRSLAKLRELFNDPLFVRTSHGMEPTSRAMALSQPLQRTLDQLSSLLISQDFSPKLCQRNFRLHMSSYTSQAHLAAIATDFYLQAPNAQLEIIDIKGKSLQHHSAQVIDLALGSQMTYVPDYFHQLSVGEEQMRCFMSATHPLANAALDLESFLQYPHAVVSLGGGPNLPLESQLNALGKSRKVGFRTPHYLSALEVVSNTQMLFNTSPIVPQGFARHFNLVAKKIPLKMPVSRYYLSWPPTLHKDPAHQWLRELCAKAIRANLHAL